MDTINLSILAPLIGISLLLTILALVDLIRRPFTNGPKFVWVLIILLLNLIGPILYFIFGRREA